MQNTPKVYKILLLSPYSEINDVTHFISLFSMVYYYYFLKILFIYF